MLRSALMRSSPSYRIGRLMFNSQEGAQLANVDAALKIIEQLGGASFLEVSSVPGKFSEYLLWRSGPNLRGFGLYTGPVPIQHFVFLPQCQADNRYEYLSKKETSWSEASELVSSRFESAGVELAVADLPSVDSKNEDSPAYQKQLLTNALLCLRAVQPGGCCLLKFAGISTEVSFQLVWLLRTLFKQFSVMRPFSLGSLSGCIFLYFQNLVQGTHKAVQVLTSAVDALESSGRPLQRFLNKAYLDSDTRLFDLIQNFNHRLISSRIDAAKLAIKYVEDSSKPPIGPPTPEMQSYAKTEWSLD
ncbi:hypothetical protein DSO57_1012587 [Entomophthora muscae]|uniref:Uncharacterized protein n=1 Tax=Entomophthora muscae TaxID=34485 RepID=A0ACC2UQR2_9FUNG|nr:hypothetical protein DSO57_1012587 [Entomophthora muscae]